MPAVPRSRMPPGYVVRDELHLWWLEYLFFAGDDRFGALGVSASASDCLPRRHGPLPQLADVQAMHDLVRRVEAGEAVEEPLRRLVTPGATLGGARPKALFDRAFLREQREAVR